MYELYEFSLGNSFHYIDFIAQKIGWVENGTKNMWKVRKWYENGTKPHKLGHLYENGTKTVLNRY